VPSIALSLGDRFWWPSALSRGERPAGSGDAPNA
jgi:uncharacterized membrane protein YdfJ with MMPL/SSD domain